MGFWIGGVDANLKKNTARENTRLFNWTYDAKPYSSRDK